MNTEEARFHLTVLVIFIGLIIGVSVLFAKQNPERKQKLFHHLLGLTCFGTFFLIFVGAMVATTRSGMAFMDWPTSNGLIWPGLDKWIHQKDMFWEHIHRLIAEGVGILAICLLIWSFFFQDKKYVKATALLLIAIIIQGIFGGLTVGKLTAWWTSTLHGMVAQLVFAFMLILYFESGTILKKHKPVEDGDGWLYSLPKAVCIIVLIQLFLGASFRHKMKVAQFSNKLPVESLGKEIEFKKPGVYNIQFKANAEGDFSGMISDGQVINKKIEKKSVGEKITLGEFNVEEGKQYSLALNGEFSDIRIIGPERLNISGEELKFEIVYKEVIEGNRHLLWAHIGFAIVVFLIVLLLGLYLLKKGENFGFLKIISIGIMSSLLIQIVLGVFAFLTVHERQQNIYDQLKTIMTSAHLANGALLLALCAVAMYFCRAGFVKPVTGE